MAAVTQLYHALCDHLDPRVLKKATEDKSEDAGMFHWPNMNMEAACELHEELLKACFRVGKQLLPKEVQSAMHRFNSMHNDRLFFGDSTRGVRQQAQGIANLMSYVNTKRRNTADGSRTKSFMNRLVEASAGSEGTSRSSYTTPSPKPRGASSTPSPCEQNPRRISLFKATESDIFKIFGLDGTPSSCAAKSSIVEIESSQEGPIEVQEQPGLALQPPYTDFAKGILVRALPCGQVEEAVMYAPKGAVFLRGRFKDGTEFDSEMPVLASTLAADLGVESAKPKKKKAKSKAKPKKKPKSKAKSKAKAKESKDAPPKVKQAKATAKVQQPEAEAEAAEAPRGCTIGEWSLMYYKPPKNAFGIRSRTGGPQMASATCRDKDPFKVHQIMVDYAVPALDAKTDKDEIQAELKRRISEL